jgi:hypothetical protein
VTRYSSPYLDVIDIYGVPWVGDLQRGSAGVQDNDPSLVLGQVFGRLGQAKRVPIEGDSGVVVIGGDH